MGKINLLSFEVANLIAAGEVVDRPASAVKELLENAIDSGADKITLEIQRGGVSFIRVADNGCGIDKEDLEPAITRHSTSKISTAADLSSIMTLGFRGEALAAIAAVSKLRIFSKVPGKVLGALLEADGGKNVSVSDTGCQEGTTVIVEDLFFNVPARRKFLKKDSTEAIAIGGVIEKIALSHPEIAFKFISDGEIKFMTTGNGNLRETIWALFGRDTAKRAIAVDRSENGIRISGFISEPDIIKSNRNSEYFFINGRCIKSRTASAAIEQAYSSKIPHDKFPFCVLNIDINPAAVDVNVHPAKLEVKFANEKLIFDAVYYAVISALDTDAQRPELTLRKEQAKSNPFTPNITSNDLKGAFAPLDTRRTKSEQVPLTESHQPTPPKSSTCPPEIRQPSYISPAAMKGSTPAERADRIFNQTDDTDARKAIIERLNDRLERHSEQVTAAGTKTDDKIEITPITKTPVTENKPEEAVSAPKYTSAKNDPYAIYDKAIDESEIPDYFIIGEAWNCYVMVQIDDRILMIDKHAAHERIIFDELCRKMRASLHGDNMRAGQMLLAPIEVAITPAEADSIEEYGRQIRAIGFDYEIEQTSVSSYKAMLKQIPSDLDKDAAAELWSTLTTRLSDSTGTVESAAEGFFETRLWQASCKAAIKGGRVYDIAHIKWICDRLLKKPDAAGQVIRTCPHGRPVAFEIKKSSIDRQFDRLK